jgi:hypothetical protein
MGAMTIWWVGEDDEGNRGILETKVFQFWEKEIVGKRGWWIFKKSIRILSQTKINRYFVKFSPEEGLLLMCENVRTHELTPLLESQDYQEILSEAMDQNTELITFYKNATKTFVKKNSDNYARMTEWISEVQSQFSENVALAVKATQQKYDLFFEHLNINVKESDLKRFKALVARDVAEELKINLGPMQYQSFNPPEMVNIAPAQPPQQFAPQPQPQQFEDPQVPQLEQGNFDEFSSTKQARKNQDFGEQTDSAASPTKASMGDQDDLMDLLEALENDTVVIEDSSKKKKR